MNKPLPSLDELQRKIDAKRGTQADKPVSTSDGDMAIVMRFSVELLAGLLVGCAVGYGLDQWFGTLPVFSIVCLFLGIGGGMLNVIRSAKKIDEQTETNHK